MEPCHNFFICETWINKEVGRRKVLNSYHGMGQALHCMYLTLYLSVFSPNAGKNGPEKTPYLDTFHAVTLTRSDMVICFMLEVVLVLPS